jgi:isocitrate dehydrogenase
VYSRESAARRHPHCGQEWPTRGSVGWSEAARLIEAGIDRTIQQGKVTCDLARRMTGAIEVKTSQFGNAIIANM